MAKKDEPNAKLIGTRFPLEMEKRIQAVTSELTRRAAGVPVTMSGMIHLLVGRGLESIESELGLPAKASKPTKSSSTRAA